MPYIKPEDRKAIDAGRVPENAGELNYLLTMACIMARLDQGPNSAAVIERLQSDLYAICQRFINAKQTLRYAAVNDVLGALDGAQREAQRRAFPRWPMAQSLLRATATKFYDEVAAPYEDAKRIENGDIAYV